jgi:hypothetical protein
VTQLERQVEELSGAEPVEPGVDLTDDLDSLREFTTLLRRDQTALADTVGDLEARVGALETKVDTGLAALDKRVSTLESNAFTISGSITLNYYVSRTWYDKSAGIAGFAPDFDVDRLGLNVGFSSGTPSGGSSRDFADFGGSQNPTTGGSGYRAAAPVGGTAPNGSNEGRIDPQFNIAFALKPRNLIGGGFPAGQITLTMSLDATGFGFNNGSLSSITSAVKFSGLKALFDIGGAPLTITYGVKPAFKFSNFAFNSGGRGDGFVANLDGSSILPFSPTLTVVYGSQAGSSSGTAVVVYTGTSTSAGTNIAGGNITNLKVTHGRTFVKVTYTAAVRGTISVSFSDGTTRTFDAQTQTTGSGDQTFLIAYPVSTNSGASNANVGAFVTSVSFASTTDNDLNSRNGDNNYFTGVRGTLSIIPGLTGGVYYGHNGNDVTGGGLTDTIQDTYGLFFNGKAFGFLGLEGEYSIYQNSPAPAEVALYTKANVDLGIFTIGANYRFVSNKFGTLDSDGAFPYSRNQSGFGIDVAVNQLFGFLDLSGYFDSRSKLGGTYLPNGPKQDTQGDPGLASSATNFGFGIGIRLIGFDIAANYDGITETGNQWNETLLDISAKHDGSKADALIGGLNLIVGFKSDTVSAGLVPDYGGGTDGTYNTSVIYAYADFALDFGGLKIKPQVYFSSTSGNALAANVSDLGGSLTVSTPFLFGSKLSLYGGLDQATRTTFTSSTSLIRFSIGWDSFLLPNSNFSASFATRTDVNRNGRKFGPSFAAPIGTDLYGTAAWGGDGAGRGGNLYGLYLTYGYYGLSFTYGIFNLTSGGPGSQWGQEFSIGYKLTF